MKKITIKTSGDVYKSNPLLESSLGMSVIMGRIFTLALLQVQPILTSNGKFTGFERINIEPEIVKNICGCGFTSYYKRLKYEVDNFKNWVISETVMIQEKALNIVLYLTILILLWRRGLNLSLLTAWLHISQSLTAGIILE